MRPDATGVGRRLDGDTDPVDAGDVDAGDRGELAERLVRVEGELAAVRELVDELAHELGRERDRRGRALGAAIDKERHRANQAIQALVDKERHRANRAISQAVGRLRNQVADGFAERERKRFQPFARRISAEDEDRLLAWAERLGLDMTSTRIRYLEHRLNHLEDVCQGRLAARIQDALLRVLVGLASPRKELRCLEIGTLFGIGAVALWDLWSSFFRDVHLTLVDPLAGYYSEGPRDPVTGIPVSLEVLERNLRLAGMPPDAVTVLRGLSGDPEIVERAGRSRYDVVVVDGDHSYDGVAADFRNYRDLIDDGGFLVFDDYDNAGWPGVKQAVDELVAPAPELELVGTEWSTAVFRRRRAPE